MKMIESFKKHPFFSTAQVLAAVVVFPSFYSAVSFFVADTPETAIQKGFPLPLGWSAGVMNHGQYYRWWQISERPLFFALSISILGTALIILWSTVYFDRKMKKANKLIQRTAKSGGL